MIERSAMLSSDSRVCSPIIDAILIALPSTVESNWKSIAQVDGSSSCSCWPHRARHSAAPPTLAGTHGRGVWWHTNATRPASRRRDQQDSDTEAGVDG